MQGCDVRSFGEQISFGNVRNTIPWSKTGYNADVGVTSEDMWSYGGVYVWPAAAVAMEVISTGGGAANDAAAGTGVQQVQIGYLDASYNYATEIVTMTGGVAAPCVANMFRIQSFRAYRVGATVPAAAAGTINLRSVAGAVVVSQIPVGFTRARNNCWTVPAGKMLYVTSVAFSTGSAAGNKAVLMTTRATYDDASALVLGPNFFMPYHEIQVMDGVFIRQIEVPTKLPATTDIKVSAQSDSAGAVCTSVLRGYLVTL